jgi:hypothetical protein
MAKKRPETFVIVQNQLPGFRRTLATQPNSSQLWSQHYNEGFFRVAAPGTSSPDQLMARAETSAVSNVSRQSAPEIPVKDQKLPEDLRDRLVDADPYVASFRILQEWDAYVIEIGEETFKARLTDVTGNGARDAEEVEIPLEDLDDDERRQLAIGRLFRWSIGYQRFRSGQKERISRITLRQLPRWTRNEMVHMENEARKLSKALQWE